MARSNNVSTCFGLVASFLLFLAPMVSPLQKGDYLTDEEIEQLREAQDPPQRIKLLDEFLKTRLERAKSLKPEIPSKEKGAEHASEKSDESVPRKKAGTAKADSNKTQGKHSDKPFADLMGEYLQCLEEVSSNVENFSSVNIEPKAYLKSLKSLDQSLDEQRNWMIGISTKLDKSERNLISEISEELEELSQDVKAGIQKANEQIKQLKEASKAKNRR
jgi:uncharacterized phage infection (PIP) family protein YhgE